MKNRLTSHWGFVATAFLLATAVAAIADIQDMTKAKVVRIKGSARFTTGTGSWQPLKVGDILTSGSVIQTAAGSRVDVVLGDPKAVASSSKVGLPFGNAGPASSGVTAGRGPQVDQNFLRLMENTVISIDKLAATDTGADIVTDTQLDLRAGRIFGTVKKLSPGSRYEVRIPNGVAGVRGTAYMQDANGDSWCYKGNWDQAIAKEDGEMRKVQLKMGQKYIASKDAIMEMTPQELQEGNEYYKDSAPVLRTSTLYPSDQERNPDDPVLSNIYGEDNNDQGENNNNQGNNNSQ